jgi:hypothetical protein
MVGLTSLIGCTYDKAQPTPSEEANQRKNLREVRGQIDQFKTDVGDPEGRGQIPRGR